MTSEQRDHFDAYTARHRAAPVKPGITCMLCEKLIADFPSAPQKMPVGVVPIPFFGTFCSQGCANTFEREYGIQFKRDATGKVSYD